jgi:hypothetical protein
VGARFRLNYFSYALSSLLSRSIAAAMYNLQKRDAETIAIFDSGSDYLNGGPYGTAVNVNTMVIEPLVIELVGSADHKVLQLSITCLSPSSLFVLIRCVLQEPSVAHSHQFTGGEALKTKLDIRVRM